MKIENAVFWVSNLYLRHFPCDSSDDSCQNAARTRVSKQHINQNELPISGSNAIAFRKFWSAMSMDQLFPGAQWVLKIDPF